jgi:hypothetical protein
MLRGAEKDGSRRKRQTIHLVACRQISQGKKMQGQHGNTIKTVKQEANKRL